MDGSIDVGMDLSTRITCSSPPTSLHLTLGTLGAPIADALCAFNACKASARSARVILPLPIPPSPPPPAICLSNTCADARDTRAAISPGEHPAHCLAIHAASSSPRPAHPSAPRLATPPGPPWRGTDPEMRACTSCSRRSCLGSGTPTSCEKLPRIPAGMYACITWNACLWASCLMCVCHLCAPSYLPGRAKEGREGESEGARVRARKHLRTRAFTLSIDQHRLACMQVHQNMCISVNAYLCASHPPLSTSYQPASTYINLYVHLRECIPLCISSTSSVVPTSSTRPPSQPRHRFPPPASTSRRSRASHRPPRAELAPAPSPPPASSASNSTWRNNKTHGAVASALAATLSTT